MPASIFAILLSALPPSGDLKSKCRKTLPAAVRAYTGPTEYTERVSPSLTPLQKQNTVLCEANCQPSGGWKLVEVRPTFVFASSVLANKSGRYEPEKSIDGNPATAWVEGAHGAGKKEGLVFFFDAPTKIDLISLVPGYARSKRLFLANNQVKEVEASFHFWPMNSIEPDLAAPQWKVIDSSAQSCSLNSDYDGVLLALSTPEPRNTIWNISGHWCQRQTDGQISHVVLRIADTVKGKKHNDTAISEVAFYRLNPVLGSKGWVCKE